MKSKKATLYRMVTDEHICPYGIKSKALLEKEGYEVEDHHLKTRSETDEFKQQYNVATTPQTFIDGERIGGHDALVDHFGSFTFKQEGTTYQPIIAIFTTSFLLALAVTFTQTTDLISIKLLENFIAISMTVLAIQKLQDLYAFSNQFITYDVFAKKFINYAYIYPFGEGLAGIAMVGGVLLPYASVVSIFIGMIGAFSVIKAVYVEKRELKCACVGGDSSVPLGFVSLTENLMMIAMGVWMLI